ncbi:MAG: hypothetical protein K6G79_08830 [Bacteroidales bacterium]|nr:hypothetical protein [Bacteroidales bacterium]
MKIALRFVVLALAMAALAGCEQPPMLSVNVDRLDFNEKGGSGSIPFVANKAWSASSTASWLKVSPSSGDASDKNNVTLAVTCDANDGYDSRSCTVTIRCEDLSASVQVVQSEAHGIVVGQTGYDVSYAAQDVKVSVSANVDYKVTVASGASGWLKVVSTKGLQSGSVVLSVAENTTGASRSGNVVLGDSAHGLSESVTVNQMANPTGRVVNPEAALGLPYEGCSLELDIETNVKDYILVPPIWMYLTGSDIKEEGGKFINHAVWAVAANDEFNVREGVVKLHSLDGLDTDFLEIKITQEPLPKTVGIADPAFKKYLVENFDVNGDGQIEENEALLVEEIDIVTDDVESMTELGSFPNLKALYCIGSKNEDGTYNGKLKNLVVADNAFLEVMNCSGNILESIDVSANPELWALACHNNKLTELDVSHNPLLESLFLDNNQLKEFDITKNHALVELWCPYNQISDFRMSEHPELKWLYCYQNDIAAIDVSGCPKLLELWASDNRLSEIDVSANRDLSYLVVEVMDIASIDVSNNSKLEVLSVVSNKLTSIDVSHNPLLQELWFGGNKLVSIDLASNPLLTIIHAENNFLKAVDVSACPLLSYLRCSDNRLTTLDVSRNPALEYLDCTGNSDLKELWLGKGQTIATLMYDVLVTKLKYKDVAGSPAPKLMQPSVFPSGDRPLRPERHVSGQLRARSHIR